MPAVDRVAFDPYLRCRQPSACEPSTSFVGKGTSEGAPRMGKGSSKAAGAQAAPRRMAIEEPVEGMAVPHASAKALDAVGAWVQFIEARDRYHRLSADPKADRVALAAAREVMQEAYLFWSSH